MPFIFGTVIAFKRPAPPHVLSSVEVVEDESISSIDRFIVRNLGMNLHIIHTPTSKGVADQLAILIGGAGFVQGETIGLH
jgi:hypothetical protein